MTFNGVPITEGALSATPTLSATASLPMAANVSVSSLLSVSSPPPTSLATALKPLLNAGAIAGGTAGGFVLLAFAGLAIYRQVQKAKRSAEVKDFEMTRVKPTFITGVAIATFTGEKIAGGSFTLDAGGNVLATEVDCVAIAVFDESELAPAA